MDEQMPLRCWAQIDLDALAANFALLRGAAGGAGIMAIVKADAYGHGDVVVAPYLEKLGAAWFGVSCLAEARRLRRSGIQRPILILGYTPPQQAAQLAQLQAVQAVTDLAYAHQLERCAALAGQRVAVHLAMDSGMGRIGFCVLEAPARAHREMLTCCALPHLQVCGAFTHFSAADSDDAPDAQYTRAQYEAFTAAVARLRAAGVGLRTVHCCNSAALFTPGLPKGDLVRPGIVLYGLPPSPAFAQRCAGLRPALRMKASVAMVKPVRRGQYVSYGRTWRAPRDVQLATVTAGYADGYPRALSNLGVCGVHGLPVAQVGNVCMDQLMLDVTGVPGVRAGDEVTLFGGDGADSAAQAAHKAGTIGYTLLCGLGRRVPRVYMKNGAEIAHVDYLED